MSLVVLNLDSSNQHVKSCFSRRLTYFYFMQYLKFFRVPALLLSYSIYIIFLLSGCGTIQTNKETLASDSQEPVQIIQRQNTLYWGSVNMKLPSGMSDEDYQKVRKNYYTVDRFTWKMAKRDRIAGAKSWQDAHLEAKSMIEATRNDVIGFEIAQETASTMLRSFFFQLDPTPEVAEAIEYYMNVLLAYNYYREPNLFAPMLLKLQGRWSKERIQEIAKRSVYENTHFFQDKFSADTEFKLMARKQLVSKNSNQSSSPAEENVWTLKTPLTSEETIEAERIKTKFRSEIPQVLAEQRKKLKPKDWGAWVFGNIESLIVLDMLAQ